MLTDPHLHCLWLEVVINLDLLLLRCKLALDWSLIFYMLGWGLVLWWFFVYGLFLDLDRCTLNLRTRNLLIDLLLLLHFLLLSNLLLNLFLCRLRCRLGDRLLHHLGNRFRDLGFRILIGVLISTLHFGIRHIRRLLYHVVEDFLDGTDL